MYGSQLSLNLETLNAADLGDVGELGEVFTRDWVVNLILDLVGYVPDRDLGGLTVVEPACGQGAFLGPVLDRLLESAIRYDRGPSDLAGCLRAMDLRLDSVEAARKLTTARLVETGMAPGEAEHLVQSWVLQGDFLLAESLPEADLVVGNPPYVRLESVPSARMAAYRRACPTMKGRSDLYVGFIERGLDLLKKDGVLGFIVADRWMHNQYGAQLRDLVSRDYSVEAVIEMHDVNAFEDEVSAYPAITVIRRQRQSKAVLARADAHFGSPGAGALARWATAGRSRSYRRSDVSAARLDRWFPGPGLWPSGDPQKLALLAELERRFPPLQDHRSATRVGIGVATGADDVFVTREPDCVEPERLLPLLMAPDVATGAVEWSGTWLVNPWDGDRLVEPHRYPRLAAYLQLHRPVLNARHVAQRQPAAWFRTIDKVRPGLLEQPKLVLPDIKASSHPVLDDGGYYPHHNLYYVVSESWDLEVLGGLLISEVTNLFVGAYSVKMRGGCYRFQAQYLRRIRVPAPSEVGRGNARMLARAFRDRDVALATAAAVKSYGIDPLPEWRMS